MSAGSSVLAAFLATMIALPANAATSFPDYPLQTGTGSIPPNILFILDDSGSMAWDFMPGAYAGDKSTLDRRTSPDRIGAETYVHNALYYDPRNEYEPWLKADGSRYTAGTSLSSVYTHHSRLEDAQDLSGQVHEFYVPKENVTDLTDSGNFDRYAIANVGGVLRVIKNGGTSSPLSVNNIDINNNRSRSYTMSVPADTQNLKVWLKDGSGDADLYVSRSGVPVCSSRNNNTNFEECSIESPAPGSYEVEIRADKKVKDVDLRAEAATGTFATPGDRSEAEEIKNYATWYSYHRTRMKTAKAGASEAFGQLGDNFRVGYDSIWNRNGTSGVSGSRPAYPIPVADNDGLFTGSNKEDWFGYLHRANGNSGTPLHGALARAGQYYEETGAAGPWGPQAGDEQLSCRQNYSILTSDGYWNNNNAYSGSSMVGNADGTAGELLKSANGSQEFKYDPALGTFSKYKDGASNTLADVAMYYWKRDLRTLPNNVPTSGLNPAFWQHMVTFGISIGLQGTLHPENDPPLIESGDKAWPNPWHTTTSTTDSWGNESNWRIDDLLHASVNGRGSFVAASDPAQFATALKETLAAIQARRASGSNVASNGPSLNSGSHIFQATYVSGEWSGDIEGISIVGGPISGDSSWSMADVANEKGTEFLARPVFTWGGSAGAAFPTTAQRDALERDVGAAAVTGENNAEYIKGSRSLEKRNGGDLRDRTSPIGDIVNSSPFYVPQSNSLFIGANDGMLHGVNAGTGATMFSYVPAGLSWSDLATLSDPEYEHRFFVDGGIDVSTTGQGRGKNILAASLGRGGKGIFALDVTATSATPLAFGASNVLWDRTFNSDASPVADSDMGYLLGAPLVRQGNNDRTLVITSNGIESDGGKAVLFIYVLSDSGAIQQTIKLDTGVGGGNGLAEARAADVTNDGKADFIYAGDLKGNVWKFDVTSANPNQWRVAHRSGATPVPMFTARDAANNPQPITAAVALALEPGTNKIFVLFGTGKYVSNGDLNTQDTQTLYALIDNGAIISSRSELHEREIPYVGKDSKGRDARAWESFSPLPAAARGWFVDLGIPKAGERVVTAPSVRGRALWFSSIIPQPGSGCESGGTGYLNAVDVFTGTNPQYGGDTATFIDVDADGKGNDKLANGPGGEQDGFITSVDVGIGMPGQSTNVGNSVYVCGSDGLCDDEKSPPLGDEAKRLSWRELFNRN